MPELNFDSSKVEPVGKFEPIPEGKYQVMIIKSEIKDGKKDPKHSKVLHLTYKVIEEGKFKNRQFMEFVNVVNANPTAEDIGKRALSAIIRAANNGQQVKITKSEELHNKPFVVKLKIQKGDENYDDSNKVAGYFLPNGKDVPSGTTGAPVANGPAANNQAPPAEDEAMPWDKE